MHSTSSSARAAQDQVQQQQQLGRAPSRLASIYNSLYIGYAILHKISPAHVASGGPGFLVGFQ